MATTLAERVHEVLSADGTLMAILTGGLYLIDEPVTPGAGAEMHPINPTDTPSAYTTIAGGSVPRLKPCGTVQTTTENTVQTGQGRRTWVWLTFYDRDGYAGTRSARERARAVLHDTVLLAGGKNVELHHENDLTNEAERSIIGGDGKRPVAMERSHYSGIGRW